MYFINKIRKIITSYRGLIGNFSYLSILEVLKFVLPFVTIPFLVKVLGVEKYGLVAFAQALAMYFSIIVNFGLDISAVKDVAVSRDNKEKLGQIVSSVISIKSIIFLFLFLIVFILVFHIPILKNHKLLYLFSMSICLSEIFSPAWFFQGLEKMKYITFVRLINYSVYTILVFIIIKDSSSYFFVPLLYGLGTIAGGIFAYYTVVSKEKLSLYIPRKDILYKYFKDSTPFFLSRVSNTINTTMAKVMSGIFLGMNDVALLDIAEKIVNAGKIPIQTLSSVVYPHIAIKQDKIFVRKMFYVFICLGVLLTLIVFLFAGFFVKILSGLALLDAIPILRLLSIILLLSSVTFYLGSPVLVSFGFIKPFNRSSIYAAIFLMILYAFFYLINYFNITIFIYCALLAELFVAVFRFYYCNKYNLLNLRIFK